VTKQISRMRLSAAGLATLCAVAAAAVTTARPTSAVSPPVRHTMSEIFDALVVLAPVAYGARTDSDSERVSLALSALARSTAELERHAQSRDPGFAHLALGLSSHARTMSRLVASGHDAEALSVVRGMVNQCVACHTRVPAAESSRSADALLTGIAPETLPLEQRAHLEIATRRFDAAIDTYERLLASAELSDGGAVEPALVRYLSLCLARDSGDERAATTLRALAQRADVGEGLRADLEQWIRSIEELRNAERSSPRLARARQLQAESDMLAARSSARRALVLDLETRLALQQFIEGAPELSPDIAEAWYRMGVVEERIWQRPWLSNAGSFLEGSIRLAPGEPFARDAYQRLERIWVLGYTGSGGTRIPPEVQQRLRELDEAVRRAQS
jgi:hypothetical protein